jgi:hypothetical protein
LPKGGKRLGAGRKADPIEGKRRQRWFMLTDAEYSAMKATLQRMREAKAEAKSDSTHET